MNVAGSLFALAQYEAIKKQMESDQMLAEITLEDKQRKEDGEEKEAVKVQKRPTKTRTKAKGKKEPGVDGAEKANL